MRLVVLGAGESGTGAAILGKKQNWDVFVSDRGIIKEKYKNVLSNAEVKWEEGQHSEGLILNADLIVKSPGIPETAALIVKLRERGLEIISEIEFAGRYTQAIFIGITGSNGKTTTTLLTHHMLQKAGLKVGLAGNVGKSLALQVAENDQDYYVLELSSFQLDDMFSFRTHIAILLNITPDHLDRYNYEFGNYVNSKFRIIQNQKAEDSFIYCADDEAIVKGLEKHKTAARHYPFSLTQKQEQGAYIKNEKLIIYTRNKLFKMSIHDLALQGKHNAYNSMAAGIAGRILEIRKELVRDSLADFQNVEHRLEFVAEIHGITFINDSKATNVNSTWFALESQNAPVIWIVGGVDKGNNYAILEPLVKEKVKAIICLGTDNSKIIEFFKGKIDTIVEARSASDAVNYGYQLGKKGDVVLLSPTCASFDLFDNYEERGHKFKQAVKAL